MCWPRPVSRRGQRGDFHADFIIVAGGEAFPSKNRTYNAENAENAENAQRSFADQPTKRV
jgi:hypothetical protein